MCGYVYNKSMLIDLSVPLDQNTPAYPGDPTIQIVQTSSVADAGYLGHSVTLGTHTGTHIDAPAHMIQGAVTLGKLPLEAFTGDAKVIVELSEEAVEAAKLEPGDIVLFDTGTSSRYYEASYFTDYPVMPLNVAEYLVKMNIKLVGMDTCSADNKDDFPIHKILLGAGIPIIENMANLATLHDRSFKVYAVPLKLDLDGAPVRVFAEVQNA